MDLFDLHVRIGESVYGYSLTIPDLLRQMDELAIRRAVLCPVRTLTGDRRAANDEIAHAVAMHTDRFAGFARVDPWDASAISELDRCISDLGLRGVLLDPWEDHFVISSALVDPVIARAGELRIPVLINGGYPQFSHPAQIGALAARHPKVQFIATHGGQLNISGQLLAEARAMLRANPNVAIETSGVYRLDYIEDTIAEFGSQRVYFGSGAPIFDARLEVLRVRMAHVEEAIKRAIGFENVAALLSSKLTGVHSQ